MKVIEQLGLDVIIECDCGAKFLRSLARLAPDTLIYCPGRDCSRNQFWSLVEKQAEVKEEI